MPITTWLTVDEEIRPCFDDDLRPLLQNIHETTGTRWVALPYTNLRWTEKVMLYLKALTEPPRMRYSLFMHLGGHEYQVINFFLEHSGTSINTLVPKEVVMAYLFGLLGQAEQQPRR